MRLLLLFGLVACAPLKTDAPTESDTDTDADTDADTDSDADDVPLDGFGAIDGDCGVLDDGEWDASTPFLFRNTLDLAALSFDETELSVGGAEVYADGNLGGSSLYSEVFAFEILYRCELAELLLTETEITYDDSTGKKTDLVVEIDDRLVGVSVTRAFHYPPEEPYTVDEARALLGDKLGDVLLSADNAADVDDWDRSILHVIAYDSQYADVVEQAWDALPEDVRDETIVVVTATDGADDFIY